MGTLVPISVWSRKPFLAIFKKVDLEKSSGLLETGLVPCHGDERSRYTECAVPEAMDSAAAADTLSEEENRCDSAQAFCAASEKRQ